MFQTTNQILLSEPFIPKHAVLSQAAAKPPCFNKHLAIGMKWNEHVPSKSHAAKREEKGTCYVGDPSGHRCGIDIRSGTVWDIGRFEARWCVEFCKEVNKTKKQRMEHT